MTMKSFMQAMSSAAVALACFAAFAEANVKTRKARLYMVNVQGSSKVAKSFRDDWMKKTALSAKEKFTNSKKAR